MKTRRVACVFVAVALAAYVSIPMIQGMIRSGIVGADYYTFVRNVTQPLAQSYQLHSTAPFAYPPTMALVFWPFAQIGFPAFAAFSIACFLAACWRHLEPVPLVLAVVAMPLVNAISLGQLTALVVSLALFGLAASDRKIGGIALALAAAMKPQLLALFPLYLLAIRDWRGLAYSAGGYLAIVAASIAAFGPSAWIDWLGSLATYRSLIVSGEVLQWVVTPIGMAERMGMPVLPVAIVCVLCALALPFLPYRTPVEAMFGLSVAALCILPYGLPYDALGVVPFAALMIARGNWLPVFFYSFIFPPAAMAAMIGEVIRARLSFGVGRQEIPKSVRRVPPAAPSHLK